MKDKAKEPQGVKVEEKAKTSSMTPEQKQAQTEAEGDKYHINLENLKMPLLWCYLNLGTAQRMSHDNGTALELIESVMEGLNEILTLIYLNDDSFHNWQAQI